MTRLLAAALITAGALPALGQGAPAATASPSPSPAAPPAPPLVSPEVHGDGRVTFRLRAPGAREVLVAGEWSREKTPLGKDEAGVWSATLGPLQPDLYGYSFTVDGLVMLDPANSRVKLARQPRTSILEVPGPAPRVDQLQDVPHGTLRIHTYVSRSLGRPRGLYVYAPPGYDSDATARFPVLYLLHGTGDNEATWTSLGRAHLILDNLLARGGARPMLLVMADGHPLESAPPTPEGRLRNAEAVERELVEDVIPFVEASYRVQPRPEARAVAGVSMGGGHGLRAGLRHPDRFAWVFGLSAAVSDAEPAPEQLLAEARGLNGLKLLWLACGRTDSRLPESRQLADLLKARGIAHTLNVVDGEHNWRQWRRYLAEIAPLLFVEKAAAR